MITNAQQIKDEADIVAVVKTRVADLVKKGANYSACCPFHSEKTASFVVSPAKGIYKCFGCGASGRAINFLMDLEGMSYPEALREVAGIMRIEVQIEKGSDWEKVAAKNKEISDTKERYYKANADYHTHYFSSFSEIEFGTGNEINLDGRTYSEETLIDFGVCIASDGYGHKATDKEALLSLGLLKKSKSNNGFYEPLKKRILFPIHNSYGKLAGFTARKLSEQKDSKYPKYLNSSESLVFDKGNLLYGYYHARKAIVEREFAYIVEGTTDVLTLVDHGIRNVVASCGTAITEKHVKQLAHKTDVVILLLDGDEAGKKAAAKSIYLFLEEQIEVKICQLPDGSDPDSFLREMEEEDKEKRAKQFREYVDENTEDAILWHVQQEYGEGKSNHVMVQALELAANYIAKQDSDLTRDRYIRDVGKIIPGAGYNVVKKKVAEVRNKELDPSAPKLTPEQQQDALKYGVCIDHNKYYLTGDNRKSIELTNFIIIPIMLAKGRDQANRIVEIKNEFGSSFFAVIDSDLFVEMNSFKKVIARQGHYLFKPYAKTEHFTRIIDKVYAEMKNCWPIHTMGFHYEGFYTWGNGITVDGEFQPVDEYGIVTHKDIRFFLPTFSKINVNMLSDEPEGEDDFAEDIIYVAQPAVTVESWAAQFHKVHGANGMVGLAYYLAALFRDIVFKEMDKTFPHLNLFGPPGSGKSYMGWSLSSMFGIARPPFNLDQGTDVGFFRKVSQIRNGLIWYDEYSSTIKPVRSKALKGMYDGSGREKGRKSNDNKTSITKVNSAVCISGQELPNGDPALLERCITLFFQPMEPTPKMVAEGDKLKAMEKGGALSQITSHLQKYRGMIKAEYRQAFQEVRTLLQNMAEDFDVKGRLLNNFSAIATVFYLISKHEKFPFKFTELMDFMLERMKEQVNTVRGSDEISGWWSMMEYLAEEKLISGESDYMVKHVESFSILDDKVSKRIDFKSHTPVVFIRLNKPHKLYLEYSRRQGIERTLDLSALKHYLKVSGAFLGETTQRFNGKNQRCWAFELSKTNAELHPTAGGEATDDMGFPIDEPEF